MKTVLFVPGYQEDLTSRNYSATMRAIEKHGYRVEFVPIEWRRTTIDHWVAELDAVYAKHDPQDTILAGFSYGAMTAFVAASKRNPSELWLFSLSPYFSDDLESSLMKPTWLKEIGHRRVSAFRQLNFKKLAQSIHCKTLLFTGRLEIKKYPIIGERTEKAHKILTNHTLTLIDNAGHDAANEHYIAAIETAISQ